MGPRLYTRGEVSALLGISHSTVIRMEASGQLATVRVGSRGVRILADSVERHLAQRRVSPGSGMPRVEVLPVTPPVDAQPDDERAG
jgi:excisionase family DNA binding protein